MGATVQPKLDSADSSTEKSFYEQGSAFLSKVSSAPKKTLRLSSPFTSFPSTALANSSVIPTSAMSGVNSAPNDDDEYYQVFNF